MLLYYIILLSYLFNNYNYNIFLGKECYYEGIGWVIGVSVGVPVGTLFIILYYNCNALVKFFLKIQLLN